MGSTIYGRHHIPSLIHIAGELVNSEDNVTPTALCSSPIADWKPSSSAGQDTRGDQLNQEFLVLFAQPDWSSHGAIISEMHDGRSDLRWFQSG